LQAKFLKKPALANSSLVAAWPGMGMLAIISAQHLRRQLEAELIAEVYSPLNSVLFKDGVLQPSRITNRFYVADNVLICIGDSQPLTAGEVYTLADQILNVGEEFDVKRVYTTAASLSAFEGEPRVFGIVNKRELAPSLDRLGVPVAEGEGSITGLNGVLLGVAAERGIEGLCLLGQIRFMDIPQPGSASAVLRILARMLNVQIDLSDLDKEASRIEESIRGSLKRAPPRRAEEKGLDYIG